MTAVLAFDSPPVSSTAKALAPAAAASWQFMDTTDARPKHNTKIATAATQGSTTANSAVAAPSSASSVWRFHHCLSMNHPTLSAFLMMLVSSV